MAESASQPVLQDRQLFIDGQWRAPVSGERRAVVNPATEEVITTVAEAGPVEVADAVTAAQGAFAAGEWSRMPGRRRAAILSTAAALVRANAEQLALLETSDTGKPLQLCQMIDVMGTAEQLDYYSALAWSLDGATRQTGAPMFAYTLREPIGVVAAITPFNFPLLLSITKIAPALAAGNTVVHKPAQDTPLSALRLAEILAEAGVPSGVFNVVTGGAKVGEALVSQPGVDKIAFTGSTAVGSRVATLAAQRLVPVTMELGGKSANIIFADANLGSAIEAAVNGFVFNAGQFCAAGTRLLVQRQVYAQVLDALTAAAPAVPVGDPLLPGTAVGPLTTQRQLELVTQRVRSAVEEQGATVLTGGDRLPNRSGWYFAPTVLTDVEQGSPIVQQEVFGPVLTVQPFDTEDEAIALANDSRYGLAAGLHTCDVRRAHRVAQRLRAGTIWVNTWGTLDPAVPFGGYRQSGYGKENGPEALDEYTNTKAVLMAME